MDKILYLVEIKRGKIIGLTGPDGITKAGRIGAFSSTANTDDGWHIRIGKGSGSKVGIKVAYRGVSDRPGGHAYGHNFPMADGCVELGFRWDGRYPYSKFQPSAAEELMPCLELLRLGVTRVSVGAGPNVSYGHRWMTDDERQRCLCWRIGDGNISHVLSCRTSLGSATPKPIESDTPVESTSDERLKNANCVICSKADQANWNVILIMEQSNKSKFEYHAIAYIDRGVSQRKLAKLLAERLKRDGCMHLTDYLRDFVI